MFAQKNDNTGALVKGRILFEGDPVPNATVLLKREKDSFLVKGTMTDSLGNYTFKNIKPGSYAISVYSISYQSFPKQFFAVDSTQSKISIPAIQLKKAGVQSMQEVIIRGKRPLIERKVGQLIFNVENSILSIGSTAWDVLQKAPQVKTDEQGNVLLRGNNNASIMINGKLVSLAGDELVVLLRSINSEDIIKMEMITNPSAKYDAEGTGGIINIVTRKRKQDGWNGTVNLGYTQSAYAKYIAGLSLSYKNRGLSISGSYSYRPGAYRTIEYLDQTFSNAGSSTIYEERLDRYRQQTGDNYKLDMSYAFDKKTTIGILFEGNGVSWHNNDLCETPIHTGNGGTDSTFLSHIFIDGNSRYRSFNASYKGQFDTLGRSLTIDVDYLKYNSNNYAVNVNDYLDVNGKARPLSSFKSEVPQVIRIYTAKLDYCQPLPGNITLEAGAKANKTTTDNNYIFQNAVNNVFTVDRSKSNHFIYEEIIAALYGNFSKTMHDLTIQLGLRGEYTNTKGNSLTLQDVVNRSYFKIFPTVYLHRKFGDNYELELNYGKRTRRPSYANMNPFRYYSTPYSYSEGNPFLQPSYSNSFEMIHTFKNIYIVTLYYSFSREEFTQIPEQDIDAKTIVFRRINLNRGASYGVCLELSSEVGKWQSYSSADISYDEVSSHYLGGDFSYGKITASLSSTQSLALTNKLSAELKGSYQFPSVSGLFHLGSYSEVSLGVKRKVLKDNGVLSLSVSDIFRGTIMPARVDYYDQKSVAKTDKDLRGLKVNFSYRFGGSKSKPDKDRETSNKEERMRIAK